MWCKCDCTFIHWWQEEQQNFAWLIGRIQITLKWSEKEFSLDLVHLHCWEAEYSQVFLQVSPRQQVHLCSVYLISPLKVWLLVILLSRHSDVCCLNSVRKNSTIELKLVKVIRNSCLKFALFVTSCIWQFWVFVSFFGNIKEKQDYFW